MSSAGGPPFTDIGGRMAIFGKLFGEQAGVPEPSTLASPEELLAVVNTQLPRLSAGRIVDDAPVFEAAAYMGEWIRTRVSDATWIAEGPYEPHLQVADRSHGIVYLLPLVSMLRTASTAGYDGLAPLLARMLDEVSREAGEAPLEELRVHPESERAAVVAWAREHRDVEDATRAALWRRCSICAKVHEEIITLHRPGDDWEGEAATAASVLAQHPFACECGGPPGEVTRFLMLRHQGGERRLGDIYIAGTHTRVGCWTLAGERVIPYDALALANDEMLT